MTTLGRIQALGSFGYDANEARFLVIPGLFSGFFFRRQYLSFHWRNEWPEERHLIECIEEPAIRAYTAILGETALRKREGLLLKWEHINFAQRALTVEHTKSRKARYIPLSDFAIDWLRSLVRVVGWPEVFVRLQTNDRWRKPEGPFCEGRKRAGLEWVDHS
jgi:integrase